MKRLSEVTTLRIGGKPRDFFEVLTVEEMQKTLKACKKEAIDFFILGKGSNVLFDDRGYRGTVIHNKIDFIEATEEGLFHVGAGYSFSLLGTQTARKGWSGLEFAAGIPGSVGGAVFMNAGANGMETCDSLHAIDFVTEEGERQHIKKNYLQFSYRYSSLQEMSGAIVGATFVLKRSDQARAKQREIISYRRRTQPYSQKSAGCMFRNPPKYSAGALIEECGFKGYTLGGAKVSDLHANFIINTDQGTTQDFLELIALIKQGVKEKTGIQLESEVRYIPY